MILAYRKIAARHFDIKHVLLTCLLASQITFKGAKFGQVGTQGLRTIFPRSHIRIEVIRNYGLAYQYGDDYGYEMRVHDGPCRRCRSE